MYQDDVQNIYLPLKEEEQQIGQGHRIKISKRIINCKSLYHAKVRHFEARSPSKKVSLGAN